MSELQDLISDIVKKEIGNMNLTNAVPCRVVNLLGNGRVQVELISTKARYIVANYSGSALKVGEITQLFYRGVISNHTAYIGASNYKPERTKFIIMESKTGLIGSELSVVSNAYVKSTNDTDIEITYNATLLGIYNCDVEFIIRIDGVEHDYKPVVSTIAASKVPICFSVPYTIEKGNHIVEILAKGLSNIECVYGFVSGQVDEGEIIFDDVFENDFIYIDNTDTVDTVLYVGDSLVPKIPDMINEKPVEKICASTFNAFDVKAVYIPDGVTEIE